MTVQGFQRGDKVRYRGMTCKVLSVGEMMIKIELPDGTKAWVFPVDVHT